MIQDRESIEMELQKLRAVTNALDGGLRRLAMGDIAQRLDMPFPDQFEGMRRDFNRGLSTLGGTIDAIIGNSRLLQAGSLEMRENIALDEETRAMQTAMLAKAVADISSFTQSVRSQKAHLEHAAMIARNARLDMRQPQEAVELATAAANSAQHSASELHPSAEAIDKLAHQAGELAAKASRNGEAAVIAQELQTLSQQMATVASDLAAGIEKAEQHTAAAIEPVEQIERELAAVTIYIEALEDHICDIAAKTEQDAEAMAILRSTLMEIAATCRESSATTEAITASLDRMDREISRIDQQATRFVPVTVINEPPRDPGRPGSHLRLVQ